MCVYVCVCVCERERDRDRDRGKDRDKDIDSPSSSPSIEIIYRQLPARVLLSVKSRNSSPDRFFLSDISRICPPAYLRSIRISNS